MMLQCNLYYSTNIITHSCKHNECFNIVINHVIMMKFYAKFTLFYLDWYKDCFLSQKSAFSKKKGLHRNWRVILPGNPAFSKKKKKKRSSPDLERLFDPETSVPRELWPGIKV